MLGNLPCGLSSVSSRYGSLPYPLVDALAAVRRDVNTFALSQYCFCCRLLQTMVKLVATDPTLESVTLLLDVVDTDVMVEVPVIVVPVTVVPVVELTVVVELVAVVAVLDADVVVELAVVVVVLADVVVALTTTATAVVTVVVLVSEVDVAVAVVVVLVPVADVVAVPVAVVDVAVAETQSSLATKWAKSVPSTSASVAAVTLSLQISRFSRKLNALQVSLAVHRAAHSSKEAIGFATVSVFPCLARLFSSGPV